MVNSRRKHLIETLLSSVLLIVIAAAAYLPLIHQLGYYRDDWNLIYAGHTQGAMKFVDIYSSDRPFIGYVFMAIYTLLGDSALPYNLLAFLIRLTGVFAFWWLLRQLWPGYKTPVFVTAVLFLVFPGFLQQPNGIQFQPHQLNMLLNMASFALMVAAFSQRKLSIKILMTVLSMALSLWSLLMMEYFIGLEGMRLILIWLIVSREPHPDLRSRILSTLKKWLPYLAIILGFMYWRSFLFVSTRPNTNIGAILVAYASSPVYEITTTLTEILKDFFEVSFLSWAVPPYQHISAARLRDFSISLALGLAIAALLWAFLRLLQSKKLIGDPSTPDVDYGVWGKCAAMIGATSVLMTTIPVIFANREVSYALSMDRFTFPGAPGAALLITGLLFWLVSGSARIWAPAFLVCVALMTHYNNATEFANWWKYTRNFWWQVSWRAPQIEPGSVLIARLPGFGIEEDYEVWGPANLIYYPNPGPLTLASEVLYSGSIHLVQMGGESGRSMRTIEVERDYTKTLVLSMPSQNSCVQVMDGKNPIFSSSEEPRVAMIAPYSRLDLIRSHDTPHTPPQSIFGADPGKPWCYYYEKASLARQDGDWTEIIRLHDEARSQKLKPGDRVEWIPFVQALAYVGETDRARAIIPIIEEDSYLNFQACQLFKKEIASPAHPIPYEDGAKFLADAFCN